MCFSVERNASSIFIGREVVVCVRVCLCAGLHASPCVCMCMLVRIKKKHGLEKAMATENNTDCNGLIC